MASKDQIHMHPNSRSWRESWPGLTGHIAFIQYYVQIPSQDFSSFSKKGRKKEKVTEFNIKRQDKEIERGNN
jgi:hypothetical protein